MSSVELINVTNVNTLVKADGSQGVIVYPLDPSTTNTPTKFTNVSRLLVKNGAKTFLIDLTVVKQYLGSKLSIYLYPDATYNAIQMGPSTLFISMSDMTYQFLYSGNNISPQGLIITTMPSYTSCPECDECPKCADVSKKHWFLIIFIVALLMLLTAVVVLFLDRNIFNKKQ